MKISTKILTAIACAAFSVTTASAAPIVENKAECKNNTCGKFRIGMYRVRNTETMNLLIEKQRGERLFIRLTDFKGKVLHEEIVARSAVKFGQKLNFSGLTDGNYTLEVSNETEKVVKNIFLSTNEVREVSRLLMTAN